MKLGELIQRVQSLYSKGVESDDSRLSRRHIYNKLLTVRSRLLYQEANKKRVLSQWNYQTLPCVELIKVPAHNCPCIPPIGCDILRSKYVLPKPINSIFGDLIQSVSAIDKSVKIDRVTINSLNFQKGNKYAKKKLQYFIQDGFLYISTPTRIKWVSVVGLFDDPMEASKFRGYCDGENTECLDYMNEDFALDSNLMDVLIELSLQELVVMFSQNMEDTNNDSADSTTEQSK
jgi:hypothetical protein